MLVVIDRELAVIALDGLLLYVYDIAYIDYAIRKERCPDFIKTTIKLTIAYC
jgi:hypothetical protein